ncbi:MAG: AAA family ATPase, partial [Anaerolineae bacterium]|nr:AAA family ATPase [Anaerolineae bacterium]
MANAKDHIPIIFLAFANEQVGSSGYLRQLREEARRLRETLDQAAKNGLCEVIERPNATLKEILDVFQDARYRNRIAIFHYGGHANGYSLLLESEDGTAAADAGGLATFLGQQTGLQLVFLNGCSTRRQVEGLVAANVPAVISTSQAIDDTVAMDFASRFYHGLANGAELDTAYAEAEAAILSDRGSGTTRGLYYGEAEDVDEHWPWGLYPKEGLGLTAKWNLPDAVNDPLFGLPTPPHRPLPLQPFLGLSYFREKQAEIFFGRGWQIRNLFQLITDPELSTNPIILLYGQSGVGKSSLLAAGMLPRLKQVAEVRYVRREEANNDLTAALAQALGDRPPSNSPHRGEDSASPPLGGIEGGQGELNPADLWRTQETSERPLVIILDQVEEIYTRPGENPTQEMADFLDALQTIFGNDPEHWPQGKLILGFRKEWLAEIRDRLNERELPYKEMFLKHLDRPGIIEAITGPAISPRLRAQYELEVTGELPTVIADDLLADRGSAIAPTLQIILTKLWENAKGSPKVFDRELYDNLRLQPANFLGQLLDQQLGQLVKAHRTESDSGLVLDLLAYHTTEVGTTRQRSRTELEEAYQHQADILPGLVQSCKDRYLLVTPAGDVDEDAPDATRLSHDTLGPLVRARFDASDKPGQRAYRLLKNRIADWQHGKTGTLLSNYDLNIVGDGQHGMQAWTGDEQRLVAQSQVAREKRKRQLRIWQGVGVAAAILILLGGITSFILWRQTTAAN